MKGKLKIVVNGCSFTYGAESVYHNVQLHEDNFNSSYPMLLDKKLKNGKVINLATCGKSNATIFCQTINYLFDNPYQNNDIVFIIQWSWPERWPILSTEIDTGAAQEVKLGRLIENNSAQRKKKYVFNFPACENLTFSYIFALMNIFDNMNIKHLHYMSTSFESHLPPLMQKQLEQSPQFEIGPRREFFTYNLDNLINKIRNHDNFVMDNWSVYMMKKNKIESRKKGTNHPDKHSHQEWTDELIEILLNKGYISSEEIL